MGMGQESSKTFPYISTLLLRTDLSVAVITLLFPSSSGNTPERRPVCFFCF